MKNRTNVRWLTQLALLAAILLVMNYTPLGYLQLGPLSASLLTVPVAIGAMTMGPMAGAILGGMFWCHQLYPGWSRARAPWALRCSASAPSAPSWSALWPVCWRACAPR